MNYSRRLGLLGLVLCLGGMLFLGPGAIRAADRTWHTGGDLQTPYPNWMRWVPDHVLLTELSLPGTHDTLSRHGGALVETQSMPLDQQLRAGIRVLDVRVRLIENRFAVHHGIVFQKIMFGEVLEICNAFLDENPSETILLYVGTNGVPDTVNSTWTPAETLRWYRDMTVQGVKIARDVVGDAFQTPLGQVRGKIVLMEGDGIDCPDCGLNYGAVPTNRYWNLNTLDDMDDKWEAVRNHFALVDTRREPRFFYDNSLAGSSDNGGVWPIDVANGTAGVDGMTIRTFRHLYVPSIYRSTGLIYMDFPGATLIGMILAHNMKYATNLVDLSVDWSRMVNDVAYTAVKDGGADATQRSHQLRAFIQHILPQQNWSVIGSKAKESDWGFSLQPEILFSRTENVDGLEHVVMRTTSKDNGIIFADLTAYLTPARLQALSGTLFERAFGVRSLLQQRFPWARWNSAVTRGSIAAEDWVVLKDSDVEFTFPVVDEGKLYSYHVWASSGFNREPVARFEKEKYVAMEGDKVRFDAGGSTDPDSTNLWYRWDLDGDGMWDGDRTTNAVVERVYGQNLRSPNKVRVEVFDGELAVVALATLEIENKAPVYLGPVRVGIWGSNVWSQTLEIVDPGLDTWSLDVDFGDGRREDWPRTQSKTFVVQHQYAQPGVYTVRLRINDGEEITEQSMEVAVGLPRLEMVKVGGVMWARWDEHPANPLVETSRRLKQPVWELVGGDPGLEGNKRVLQVPSDSEAQFFRLRY